MSPTIRHIACAGAAAGMLWAQALLSPWAHAPHSVADAAAADPGGGRPFWVDPVSRAHEQAALWRRHDRRGDAEDARRIADQPTAVWLTGGDPEARVRGITVRARMAGRIPVLVVYDIPHRDCGQYSAGGAAGASAYRAWVRRLARGIEGRQAWVVLEPDAVADTVTCPRLGADRQRLELLAEAVGTLKSLPATRVYLDAGNAGWVVDLPRLAAALRDAGAGRADGFALNVSNFQSTPVTRDYGHRISALLGGAHFVIDTSRNGTGPLGDVPSGLTRAWCNPPGRALGWPPTTDTGDPRVDAYLWVKPPGESDGPCRGGPPAGHWWPDYASRLARAAREWGRLIPRGPSEPGTASPDSR